MTIDWWTLALQVINFLVLVWLLWHFLYRPVKEVIEKRKELVEHALADAEKEKEAAETARQGFDEGQATLAQERQDMLKKVHEELEVERRQVLDAAKRDADSELESTREAIAKEREVALTEIREQLAGLAVDLAAHLLRKTGSGAPDSLFLGGLEKQLEDMPARERERLEKDLAADNARLTIVTAAPLTFKEQDQWKERISARLGRTEKTEFATDPEILGGAELRFPHAVIKFTWADQLRKAEELLRRDETAS